MFRIAMACCLAVLASAHAASAQMLQRPVTAPQDYRQLAANAAAAYGPMPKGRVLKEGEKDSGSEDAPRDAKKRAKPRP